jgi:hypothetical protein
MDRKREKERDGGKGTDDDYGEKCKTEHQTGIANNKLYPFITYINKIYQ